MASRDVDDPPTYSDEQTEAEDYLKKHGLRGFDDYMKSKLNAWEKMDLHIGITGESGAGKSTFINTTRGLRANEQGAAKVGVKQTTLTPTKYEHPKNDKFFIWDLPGVNTPEFPQAKYKVNVNFDRYDFFLILSRGRFTQNDLWLAEQVKSEKKSCLFVRTNVDGDIANNMADYPESSPESIMADIRTDCMDYLSFVDESGETDIPVFLISARDSNAYEFAKLQLEIMENFPVIKRDAFLLSMTQNSREILEKKYELLQKRIRKVASIAGIIGIVSIPGVSIAAELTIITTEVSLYRNQFGLDDKSLQQFKITHKVSVEESEQIMKNILGISVARDLIGFVKILVVTQVAASGIEETSKSLQWLLPVIGTFIAGVAGGPLSMVSTYRILTLALDKMKEVALAMIEAAIKQKKRDLE